MSPSRAFSDFPSARRLSTLWLLAAGTLLGAAPAWSSDAVKPVSTRTALARPEAAKPEPPQGGDPMDRLRERLVERLAGVKKTDTPAALDLRVATRAPTAAAGARSGAPRPAGAAAKSGAQGAPHWSYSGEVGPQAWGGLRAEFTLCSSGQRQSPIDIREGIAVDLEPIRFTYQSSSFGVVDNGHTVQVNVAAGNFIELGGRRFELQQFHFHRPSEERIDGRQFDMVAHLVHKDAEGKLAVVAVLLDRGSVQPVVQTVWNNLPLEKNQETKARVTLDLSQLLPADRRYYTYMGSLTTPPCSEGVQWVVMRHPVAVSQEQVDIFARMYPMNARPLQAASGRRIMQSN
jgi:carbonic anhydrase